MTSATGSPRTSGLTLVELILVMALLMMMMAVVTPRVGDFSRHRVLIGHGETILAMLQTARDRAAAEAVPYRLQVDSDGRACRLLRQTAGHFEPLSDHPDGLHALPEGIRVSIERDDGVEDAFVEFRPTGECTAARVRLVEDDRTPVVLIAATPLDPFHLAEDDEEDAR
ncbi:MAG: hypothetical protein GX591_07960 [Planctomycetes bacterium]|nr:hypothetical protein [Planctomycetota bacterium]